MGQLITLTVRTDFINRINSAPDQFMKELNEAINESTPYCNGDMFFGGMVVAQKTRHSDDKSIYVHLGNSVTELNAYEKTTKELAEQSPEFFEKLLAHMESELKELRKLKPKTSKQRRMVK